MRPSALITIFITALATTGAARQPSEPSRVRVQGKLSLARLVDLVSEHLELTVVYDPSQLERVQLRLHTAAELGDDELWTLTNEQLLAHGYTSVRRNQDKSLALVSLQDAASAARIEPGSSPDLPAGYQKLMISTHHARVEQIADAVRPFLSEHGSVSVLDTNTVVVADLTKRIGVIVSVMEQADAPTQAPASRTVHLAHIGTADAIRLAQSIRASFEKVGAASPPGELVPLADSRTLLIIAPEGELDGWEALLRSVDQIETVETHHYAPRHFGLDEVADLLGQAFGTAEDAAPWDMVVDRLTGSLLITTTASKHGRVQALLDRLAEAPIEARRPMRSFVIRNRSVLAVRDVLDELLDAGITADMISDSKINVRAAGAQRTPRNPARDNSPLVNDPSRSTSPDHDLVMTVDEGTNALIAIGPPRQLDQIATLLEIIDVRQSQVMLEVLLVSLTEGQSQDLGVELAGLISAQGTQIALASLFGISGILPSDTTAAVGGGSGGTAVILDPGDFSAVVRALETVNDGRSLSIPRILVNNNENGSFNSVIQEPFSSTNASDTVATTSFGGTQDAGTTVSIRPQIAEGDHLVLEYSVSLSSFTGESADPSLPPPRQQNNLSSVATIPDGYTIAVGGIELTTEAEAVSKTPILGDIPGLGALFRSTSKSASRSRFYVFIRASVLRHQDFEDLKYASDQDAADADVDTGWPEVQPRVIR